MDCGEASFLISLSLDGEAGATDRVALCRHLAECHACRKLESTQRKISEAFGRADLSSQPEGYVTYLKERLKNKLSASQG